MQKFKLLINTSNIVIGGGIQVSLSFLEELKKHAENDYHVFLSKAVESEITKESFPENFYFYSFQISPSSIFKGSKVREVLNELELKIKPDLVFTVFGPSYWEPKATHVSGFADGWCYTPDSVAFSKIGFFRRLKLKTVILIKNIYIKKSDYLIVETETAKKNIVKNLSVDKKNIFVVGNTYHQVFKEKNFINKENSNVFKLLVLSSFYPHKNLSIINDVIKKLKSESKIQFKFYLTISNYDFKRTFLENDYIENLGSQNIIDCPQLYNSCDALFLPTLLETFTANYPEAMVMKRPILTSDLGFARELCGNSALYFNPLSANDIVEKILMLQDNEKLRIDLVNEGNLQLKKFETAESRCDKYLEIFQKIINKTF